ncbi:putative prefoldin subunit 1 [Blumeria hordei DH14]|uniref:Putative prefoldin subunit 1 n=1 Tax=Blumeria graminis f. sp. hordei (strain DH14) TaxID=546991 RepID=N1J5W1_BLUG1|nr:putative prefoldin subunit 1 [Blumeria hordei DH14]
MAIPNQALQNLLQEIETQAVQAQQQLNVVKSQIKMKQREVRMLDLTATEVSQLPSKTKVYEGVGKMFVFSPMSDVEKRLQTEQSQIQGELVGLGKKLQYLETTYKNSREHIDQIFKNGGGRA